MACRRTGEVRYFVREHTDADTCLGVVTSTVLTSTVLTSTVLTSTVLTSTVPAGKAGAEAGAPPSALYTDEWAGYGRVSGLGITHAAVRHGRDAAGRREWARDGDGDGVREVHCNTCEGAGAGLRTFLRGFRGVHKFYLAEYVACYETMTNAKRITAGVVQRMCLLPEQPHSYYT